MSRLSVFAGAPLAAVAVAALAASAAFAQDDAYMKEAKAYIEAYFNLYAGVKKYIDKTIKEARKNGHTTTLFGRRRRITDLDSRNPAARGFAERTAVNSPIQGTAADLIKIAMIAVDRRLREEKLKARMLLQVQDELLLEAPEAELEQVASWLELGDIGPARTRVRSSSRAPRPPARGPPSSRDQRPLSRRRRSRSVDPVLDLTQGAP